MTENKRLANQKDTSKPVGETGDQSGPLAANQAEEASKDSPTERADKSAPADAVAAQRDEYLAMLQRLQAEFENYRKRTMRQQTDLLQRASEDLIERLLPVLDALDLALAHASNGANGEQLKGALVQIDALLRKILEHEGLERIDEAGIPFDPKIHDAVAHVPAQVEDASDEESRAPARVGEVMRAGYRLRGRVLRPAMVKVEG